MSATQRDVAELAGVTRAVVSAVLHGGASTIRVSEETAERIRKCAAELGYHPNANARNLRRSQTKQIGILHGDGFPRLRFNEGSRYFSALMDGIVEGAFRHGYTVGLCPELFSDTPEDAMADGRFDGLIWYSTFPSESNLARLKKCSIPIVLIHSKASDFDDRYPTAICDNEDGIRQGLTHLATLGHRKIGFAYDGDFLFGEAGIRREAFLQLGDAMGLQTSLIDVKFDRSGIQEYISNGPKQSAILAQNDGLASDLMIALQAAGHRVPEDISIVGFDSTSFCELQKPPLTSISQPTTALGEKAIDLLIQVINGNMPDPLEIVLPCGLDVRGSTAIFNDELYETQSIHLN